MPFNPSELTHNPLFKQFWNSDTAGMSHRGLDEVTPAGVAALAEYARTHNADGSESTPDHAGIDDEERAVIKAILEHNHYGTFFEQDALPVLYSEFGIDPGAIHAAGTSHAPVDAGTLELPRTVSRLPDWQAARLPLAQLGKAFSHEYGQRKDYYEGAGVSRADKGKRVLALLRDYSARLWAHGEQAETEIAGNALLDEFFKKPFAAVFGTIDYNGFGFGAAQSLVLGQDINSLKTKFNNARPTADTTHLAMNDQMAEPMKYVDQFREAAGKRAAAEAHERAPYLGYLIGEDSGHYKPGSLSEAKPFSSSGVNWGKAIFPRDKEIAALPVQSGFEFPIDCVDAYNRPIRCMPKAGEKIEVRDKDGKKVEVKKEIQKDADGKPVSWSAKFSGADGKELRASEVTGVILDARGKVKGDGKTSGSVNMWWYGFCDRNTAQRLYKSRYGIPQLDRDVIKVKSKGKIIEVPMAAAQKLIDADIPDLVTGETMCGFRFNEEPQQISLKNGRTFTGRVDATLLAYGPGTSRVGADNVAVHDAPGRPILGSIEFTKDGNDSPSRVRVAEIASFAKDPQTGLVTLNMKEGSYPDTRTGKLSEDIDWSGAKDVNGKLVVEQGAKFVVRGAIEVTLAQGKKEYIPASDINEIIGEIQDDLRLSQYMSWISNLDGMFATDNSKGTVVSNGMRWVNNFELDERTGDDRPDWAPSADRQMVGIQGELQRQDGDKIVWVRARYGNGGGGAGTSTQFAGWMQIAGGRIVNEGFASGAPDFGWGASGKLNWKATSSFNEYMEPEMRLQLLVNGVSDESKLQALADAGNLPGNWKKYKVAQGD